MLTLSQYECAHVSGSGYHYVPGEAYSYVDSYGSVVTVYQEPYYEYWTPEEEVAVAIMSGIAIGVLVLGTIGFIALAGAP